MAYWNSQGLTTTNINTGTNPNDGTGDDIRTAFNKVDSNFSNIGQFLGGASVDFLGANIAFNLNAQYGNITNFFSPNATGTNASFTSNITGANLIANTALYSSGVTYLSGNTYVSSAILPSGSGINLGSPTQRFSTGYFSHTDTATQVQTSSDAGILKVHANAFIGDVQDTGILGNITSDYPTHANTYVFFGHQYTTNNFIYKITDTDATLGNNIVAGGFYGGAQFGGMFLSNTTPSNDSASGALVVSGGAGIAGNLNVAANVNVTGNISSGGYQVVTTNTPGISLYSGISAFNAPVTITATNPSTSTATGAMVLSYGGLGVSGNAYIGANVVAAALVGPYYGTVQTANQPNITGLGSLGNLTVNYTLNAGSIQTTSIGVTNITATGNVNVSTINGLVGLQVTGNTTSTGFVGNFYGTLQTAAQPNITSTGALTVPSLTTSGNVATGNVSATKGTFTNVQGTLITAAQPNITSLGTLTGLTVTGNLAVTGNTAITNTVYAQGIYDNGIRVLSTSSGTGNLSISGTAVTLPATGPGNITVGSTTSIPVITTDVYGRVSALTSANISTTLGVAAGGGTGTVALASQSLTIAGGTDITTTASGQTVTVNTTSTLATVTGRGATTSTAVTLNGGLSVGMALLPTANVSVNIGSSSAWFSNIYGTAVHAQYADLAENYLPDSEYAPGTVVVFGGEKEITTTTTFADPRVAGAISTNPAYLMNGAAGGVPLALRGRIPCQVYGPVTKGDSLVTSDQPGFAQSVGIRTGYAQAVFAKALETDLTDGPKTIEAVIL